MKMHWKYLTVSLVIGWFVGGASGLLIGRFGSRFGPPWEMHEKHDRHRREHFFKELKLTPEQSTQVEAVLQASRQHLNQIFMESKPKVDAVRLATRTQIRQLLTPEQQGIFDHLNAKRDALFAKHHDHEQMPGPWHE